MGDGVLVHGVVELCGVAAGDIDAVVVPLQEEVAHGKGLERAEFVAQRELVERVAFKI